MLKLSMTRKATPSLRHKPRSTKLIYKKAIPMLQSKGRLLLKRLKRVRQTSLLK